MGYLFRSGPQSVPALRELFRSQIHATRCEAAAWIAYHDRHAIDLLPGVRDLLKVDVSGTEYAVLAVERLGDPGREALPELTALANGSSPAAGVARRLLSKWGVAPDSPSTR